MINKKQQLTKDEKIILKNIAKEYKYIARDKDDSLYIYKTKPEKRARVWYNPTYCSFQEYNHLFLDIQFTDAEPRLIKKLLS